VGGPGRAELTIGALAAAAGVSVETVRYYERRGLIDQPPRPSSGYRRYGTGDVERIAFIHRAKQLGFTLSKIGDLIRSSTSGSMDEILTSARAELEEARRDEAEARLRQEMLSALVSACEGGADECLGLVIDKTRSASAVDA
jgi:DNA-binding transcriptional MerR regulator